MLIMWNKRIVRLAIVSVLALSIRSSLAQNGFASGYYQITSGRYTECCGFAGPFGYILPDTRQAVVNLTVDSQRQTAQMTFLGRDMATVFSTIHNPPGSGAFTFSFSNGIVLQDRIQFGDPFPQPFPGQPYVSYIVSNAANGLSINGVVVRPCQGCSDVPTQFKHTNVVATLIVTTTIRLSQPGAAEVCWNSVSNRTYQLQCQSAVTTNGWTNLGPPLAGNGSTQCVTDNLAGEAQRFYRVFIVP